ncbi:hypothetical protein, partial [Halonotius roseus]|uniref:hypothetical protein n=1 Tax=Halonotius roseus TaxID=2511997 RepID=UPI001C8D7F35
SLIDHHNASLIDHHNASLIDHHNASLIDHHNASLIDHHNASLIDSPLKNRSQCGVSVVSTTLSRVTRASGLHSGRA